MNKLKLIILLIFAFSIKLGAQNVVHLCIGDDHNFWVPDNPTSTFDWSVNDPSIATIDSGNGTHHILIDLNNKGVFKLLVEEIDGNGCFGYDSVLVEIHEKPIAIISAVGPVQFCKGIDVLLQVNDIYDAYLWNDGSSASDLLVSSTGDYSVIVTNEFGCVNNSNSIHVDVQADFFADFDFEGVCANSPTTFFSSSLSVGGIINSLSWDFGNGVQSYNDSVSYSYNIVGDYEVSLFVETAIGCKDSIIKTVSIFGNPKADFTYNPFTISTLNPEINFVNTSINGYPFLWGFGDSIYSIVEHPSHIYANPGLYDVILIVKDINECMDSITKQIIMYYDFVLHVPTAFTPNDDGLNGAFGPQGLRMDMYQSYDFHIYNQWGERVFETDDINEWWTGADFPEEVYIWHLIITDELGKVRKESGLVTLIK